MLSIFTITVVGVVLCGSVVSDTHPAVDGWNALLGPRQFFDGAANTILIKSSDDGVILWQFKQLLSQDAVIIPAYLKFRTIFNKINDATRERLNQLKNSMFLVARHNLEAAAGKHTWTMAVNHFADLSLSELSVIAGSFSELDNSTLNRAAVPVQYKRKPGSAAPPSSIDYVKEGIVSSVKYQGDCGTCVMFAAAAILESADARTNSRAPLDLSPQELAECAHRGFYCKGAGSDTRTNLRYLVEHGLASWNAYPYRGDKGTISRCKRSSTLRSATALEWEVADRKHTEESLMQTLAERGPLIVAIQSNAGFGGGWFYHQGVFSGSDCNEAQDTNHSVTLVGYGKEKGLKYWLIKNSYGTSWGDEGYGKIKFSLCKILSRVSSIVAKPL